MIREELATDRVAVSIEEVQADLCLIGEIVGVEAVAGKVTSEIQVTSQNTKAKCLSTTLQVPIVSPTSTML